MNKRCLLFLLIIWVFASSYAQEANKEISVKNLEQFLKQSQKNKIVNAEVPKVEKHEEVYDSNIPVNKRKVYDSSVSLGISVMDLGLPGMQGLKNYYGAMLNIDHTYFIDDAAVIGLNVVWFDMNYNSYKLNFISGSSITKVNYHMGDASIQAGLLFRFDLGNDFETRIYARYAPSYAFLYDDNKLHSSFASYVNLGAKAMFRSVGLGFEYRIGECRFKEFVNVAADDVKTKHSGWNVNLSFNF